MCKNKPLYVCVCEDASNDYVQRLLISQLFLWSIKCHERVKISLIDVLRCLVLSTKGKILRLMSKMSNED